MPLRSILQGALAAAVAFAPLAGGGKSPTHSSPAGMPPNGELSVMSYNVKGLPWPVATGRDEALAAIAQRLAAMRSVGTQPHVVMLQEAFTDQAKQIGEKAGYRYVAGGPGASQVNQSPDPSLPPSLRKGKSWLKGETEGKWLDSGLRILSDYPIVSVRRLAFPAEACAGYDCLANKGAVLAWIAVPGSPQPIAFIDTHLNSRQASGVADSRSDLAYSAQLQALKSFLTHAVPTGASAILGGDFNTGKAAVRLADMRDGPLAGGQNSLLAALTRPKAIALASLGDAGAILRKGKDWLFYRAGIREGLRISAFSVPFGTERDGSALSDHMGYVVRYRLVSAAMPGRGGTAS